MQWRAVNDMDFNFPHENVAPVFFLINGHTERCLLVYGTRKQEPFTDRNFTESRKKKPRPAFKRERARGDLSAQRRSCRNGGALYAAALAAAWSRYESVLRD